VSFWTKLGSFFGSGVAKAVTDTATAASDIVERWNPSDAKEHEMLVETQKQANDGAASARSYDPRTTGARAFTEYFNAVVDGLTRLIRPGVTVLLMGGVFGWWPVHTQSIDPVVLAGFESVMSFWFGMRALTRDIPSLIKMLVELKRGK
jgi:hypothetical protein